MAPVDKKEKDAKEKEKKLTPSETLEKKLGSYVYLDNKEKDEITDDAKNFRPDLKKKLLKFEFTPFFRSYDELLDTLAIQQKNKDNKGAKSTMTSMRKSAKRIQGIAVAKLAALSSIQNDSVVTSAAKIYHTDSLTINTFLRDGREINWDKDELEKITRNPKNRIQQQGLLFFFSFVTPHTYFTFHRAIIANTRR